ncbi:MAG: hypothetical protein JNJ43_09795 [Anaerolineales bacterium]|nr:hypothetical protein [Anaerolineales bacterium]
MQPSSKTLILVAIITAIGGILVALIGGYFLMQNTILQKTLDITMSAYVNEQNFPSKVTDTPYFTSTSLPINVQQPSNTPQPIIPTDTLVPQNISIDTDPNSILPVGETWTSNGLSVQLSSIDFRFSDVMNINFIFINNTGKTLFFNFNESINVTLKDDKGNIYTWNNVYQQDVVLENKDTYSEQVYKGGSFSGAQYFIIELNIPGVITAKWRFN